MNIQSGTYYWPNTMKEVPTYPSVDEDISCDVLIVGGGSSGAQCAYYLSDTDLNVVLIEKNMVARGSTATNTSLLQYMGEKRFTDLVHTFGDDYSTRHMQLCQEAIDEIEAASIRIPFDSEFTRRDTLYYVSEAEHLNAHMKECEWLQERGAPVEWVSEEWISNHYSFEKLGGIYSRNDGEINSFIFTHGLLEFAAKQGVRIFEHTERVGEHQESGLPVVTVNRGHSIRAKHVIYAAGYEDMDVKKEKKARFVSTYTVTTKPVEAFPGWYGRTLLWETARPYVYIRTTKDNRVIIGGLDEDTSIEEERDSKLLHKRDQLMKELHARFPELKAEPDYYCAAFYGGTVDGLPILGQYNNYPFSYFLMAYGDNGLVYSMMLAKLLKEYLLSGKSDDLTLYDQNRPLKNKTLYHKKSTLSS
ncbi:NAD(P)/FAD-dependent oxidoreductase [Halobacillus salinus]|uniref:FAD-binding oxidoreductase n=1 Tax=Halobacillus salinus TaxID=192814 RepID=A0A4Z0GZK6_9BACI|nr:FAD-binding oxidoreductase [Halobacillus salinus]TGB02815.1 FAD-binding oxidoreductase [Halobacillus salinus]